MATTHHFPRPQAIRDSLDIYEQSKQLAIEHIRHKDPANITYLTEGCAEVFHCRAFLQDDEQRGALRDYVECCAAQIAFSVHPGRPFAYVFRGETVTVPAARQDVRASCHLWNVAFFGAIVLDDARTLDYLCDTALDALNADGSDKDYTSSMASALRAFYRKHEDYPERLLAALKDNMAVPGGGLLHAKAMDIDGPALELLYLLLLEREDEFNAKLSDALRWHRRYAAMLLRRGLSNNSVLISLPLCAMVKLAKKLKRMRIDHASAYLPPYLLE